jgi:hypothetical protein
VIDQAVRDRDLFRPAEKADAAEEVLPYVRAVRSRIQKREYFDIAMDSLRISDAALKRELWHSVRGDGRQGDLKQKVLARGAAKPTVAERQLLELMFADEGLRQQILPGLAPDDYQGLPTSGLFQALLDLEKEGAAPDFGNLSARTEDDPLAAELIPMLLMGDPAADDQDRNARLLAARRCVDTLREMRLTRRIDEIKTQLTVAERSGDSERVAELSKEQIELTKLQGTRRPLAEIGTSGH